MSKPWMYAIGVFVLFILLVAGVPLFPEVLDALVIGDLSVGMLAFLLLHVLPLILAVVYLRARSE